MQDKRLIFLNSNLLIARFCSILTLLMLKIKTSFNFLLKRREEKRREEKRREEKHLLIKIL